jgi:O-antigen/teichoic acid export membrane protein
MSVRHAALWSMGSQYAGFIIQFAVTIIISRYFLNPAEIGVYSIAVAVTMMISILQDFGLTRYISGLADIDDAKIRTCASVALVLGFAVVIAIFLSIWPVSLYFSNSALVPLLAILTLSYVFTPFHMISTALLARDLNFRGLFQVNVGSSLLSAITAIALASAHFSASALAWSMVVQAIAKTVIAQRLRPVSTPLPPQLKDVRGIVNFGTGSAALTVIGAIGVRTPDLIIGSMLGFAAVGLFSRATALAGQLYMLLSGAIGSIFYPAFARIRDRGDALGPPYTRVVAAYCAVTMPAMAGLAVAAVPLINGLFGAKWAGSAPVLHYIALSEMVFIALPLHMDIPILMGRMKTLIILNIADSLASVVLLLLAARWGLEWAAISRIAYGLVWYAIYARLLSRLIAFKWSDMLMIYAKSLIISLVAITPLLLAYRYWVPAADMSLVTLIILSGLGALMWMGSLLLVKHPAASEIRELVAAAVAPLKARLAPRRPD